MHQSLDLSHAFWNFLVLFAFTWIILFTTEPYWVQREGVISKALCAWYAFVIAIIIVLVLLVVYMIVRTVARRRVVAKADNFLEKLGVRRGDAAAVREAVSDAYQEAPGNKPLEKMRSMLNSLSEDASQAMGRARGMVAPSTTPGDL